MDFSLCENANRLHSFMWNSEKQRWQLCPLSLAYFKQSINFLCRKSERNKNPVGRSLIKNVQTSELLLLYQGDIPPVRLNKEENSAVFLQSTGIPRRLGIFLQSARIMRRVQERIPPINRNTEKILRAFLQSDRIRTSILQYSSNQ